MPSIRTRHIPAEDVKVGDCFITPIDTIEKVATSQAHGAGWEIKSEGGNAFTTHTFATMAVIDVAITFDVTAAKLDEGDLIRGEDCWLVVRDIAKSSDSARKLVIEVMKLDVSFDVVTVTVGTNKKFQVLEK